MPACHIITIQSFFLTWAGTLEATHSKVFVAVVGMGLAVAVVDVSYLLLVVVVVAGCWVEHKQVHRGSAT